MHGIWLWVKIYGPSKVLRVQENSLKDLDSSIEMYVFPFNTHLMFHLAVCATKVELIVVAHQA